MIMEFGECSRKTRQRESASILVRIHYNAAPIPNVAFELRPGGIKRTDDGGECKYERLAPGHYELCIKGNTVWRGRVREDDDLKIFIVATASYSRCCHVESMSTVSEDA